MKIAKGIIDTFLAQSDTPSATVTIVFGLQRI
jgi:hypothetical protein